MSPTLGQFGAFLAFSIVAVRLLSWGREWPHLGKIRTIPRAWGDMKTYHILIGNCEELLNDFIEALFQEVCRGEAAVQFPKTARVGEFVERACDTEFDLIIQVPHNLFPELAAPTPMGLLGEGLRAIRTVKSRSEEHTSELQSPCNLVCRLLLEK